MAKCPLAPSGARASFADLPVQLTQRVSWVLKVYPAFYVWVNIQCLGLSADQLVSLLCLGKQCFCPGRYTCNSSQIILIYRQFKMIRTQFQCKCATSKMILVGPIRSYFQIGLYGQAGSKRCNRPEYTPGRNIPGVKAAQAILYPGLLWPRPVYTPGYMYIMAQANSYPRQAKIYPHNINHNINRPRDERYRPYSSIYFFFQQVTEDSVFSGKLSEKAKLTELKC